MCFLYKYLFLLYICFFVFVVSKWVYLNVLNGFLIKLCVLSKIVCKYRSVKNIWGKNNLIYSIYWF